MVEPLGNLFESADAVLRLTGTGKLVVFFVEQADARLDAVGLEGREYLKRLHHPAAVVLIRVDEEGRGGAFIRIFERRMPP